MVRVSENNFIYNLYYFDSSNRELQVVDTNEHYSSHSFSIPANNFTATSVAQTGANASHTFICILTDLTDASNTCKRHVINLSGSYTIEHLIREAANFYSYDPFTFSLMWKSSLTNELVSLIIYFWSFQISGRNHNFFLII